VSVEPVGASDLDRLPGWRQHGEQLSAILMGSDEYKNRDVVTPTGFVDAL